MRTLDVRRMEMANDDDIMTDEDFERALDDLSLYADAEIKRSIAQMLNENQIITWEEAEQILADTGDEPIKCDLPQQTRPCEPDNDTNVDQSIQRLVGNDPKLMSVNLNNMKRTPVPQIKRIIEACATNGHIEKLSLANMGLYDKDIEPLIDVLEANESLRVLNLETNYLSGEFFARLFQAALKNQTLEEVKAVNQGVSFSTLSEKDIIKAIFQNRGLLKVSINFRLPEGRHKVDQALMRNQEIRRILRRQEAEERRLAEQQTKKVDEKPKPEPVPPQKQEVAPKKPPVIIKTAPSMLKTAGAKEITSAPEPTKPAEIPRWRRPKEPPVEETSAVAEMKNRLLKKSSSSETTDGPLADKKVKRVKKKSTGMAPMILGEASDVSANESAALPPVSPSQVANESKEMKSPVQPSEGNALDTLKVTTTTATSESDAPSPNSADAPTVKKKKVIVRRKKKKPLESANGVATEKKELDGSAVLKEAGSSLPTNGTEKSTTSQEVEKSTTLKEVEKPTDASITPKQADEQTPSKEASVNGPTVSNEAEETAKQSESTADEPETSQPKATDEPIKPNGVVKKKKIVRVRRKKKPEESGDEVKENGAKATEAASKGKEEKDEPIRVFNRNRLNPTAFSSRASKD